VIGDHEQHWLPLLFHSLCSICSCYSTSCFFSKQNPRYPLQVDSLLESLKVAIVHLKGQQPFHDSNVYEKSLALDISLGFEALFMSLLLIGRVEWSKIQTALKAKPRRPFFTCAQKCSISLFFFLSKRNFWNPKRHIVHISWNTISRANIIHNSVYGDTKCFKVFQMFKYLLTHWAILLYFQQSHVN
jgi:hypothetical protein